MQYQGLNFSELQDIPPLRRYYDVLRVSVTGKGLFAMNGAMRRQVGEQREFRAKATADGCYLVLFPGETPNIRFSAKGGSVIHTDLARTLAGKGILLPAVYTMEWCQEQQAWVGRCQELPIPEGLPERPKKAGGKVAGRGRK